MTPLSISSAQNAPEIHTDRTATIGPRTRASVLDREFLPLSDLPFDYPRKALKLGHWCFSGAWFLVLGDFQRCLTPLTPSNRALLSVKDHMHWLYLSLAILSEVAGTCMKLSAGFTRFTPSVLMWLFYAVCFCFLTLALKKVDLSVAYAIWSGVGTR